MGTSIGTPSDSDYTYNWWESGVTVGYPICPASSTFYRITFQNPLSNWKVKDSNPAVACPIPPHGLQMSMVLKFGNFASHAVHAQGDITYSMANWMSDNQMAITYTSCDTEATEVDKAICYSKYVAG